MYLGKNRKSRINNTVGFWSEARARARDDPGAVRIIIILRAHACEMNEARTHVAHALGSSRARQKSYLSDEKRAAGYVGGFAAVAGNGEQRAVSPHALSRSSCARSVRRRNELTTRVPVLSIFSWFTRQMREKRSIVARFPVDRDRVRAPNSRTCLCNCSVRNAREADESK